MNTKEFKTTRKHFFKGFAIGAAFCGSIALILLIIIWILM